MKHITQLEHWSIEVKELYFRRVDEYGKPFSASVVAKVVAGKFYLELLSGTHLKISEFRELQKFAKSLGFDKIHYERK